MNCAYCAFQPFREDRKRMGTGDLRREEERLGVVARPGSCRARSAFQFDLNFIYEELDTVYGKHSRNSGER
jgi:hypothetical protein